MIRTERLLLRPWMEKHRESFARLHSDPQVMEDLGGPIDRTTSDAKFDRYVTAFREHGTSRFAVETPDGRFVGYCGVMPRMAAGHPLGIHHEIGWRFMPQVWGRGYATESAVAVLRNGVEGIELASILACTSPQNTRSQAVMARLGLARRPDLDYSETLSSGKRFGAMVWHVPADWEGAHTVRSR